MTQKCHIQPTRVSQTETGARKGEGGGSKRVGMGKGGGGGGGHMCLIYTPQVIGHMESSYTVLK